MQAKDFQAGEKIICTNPLPENAGYEGREGIVQAIGPHPQSFAPAVTVLFGDGVFAKVAHLYAHEIEKAEAVKPVSAPLTQKEKNDRAQVVKAQSLGMTLEAYRKHIAAKRATTMAERGVVAGAKQGSVHKNRRPVNYKRKPREKQEFVRRPVVREEPAPAPVSDVPRLTDLPSLADLNAKLMRYQR